MIQIMIHTSLVHPRLRREAVHTTVYYLNCTFTKLLLDQAPFECWHGMIPLVSHVQIFDCHAYIHVSKAACTKLKARNKKDVL